MEYPEKKVDEQKLDVQNKTGKNFESKDANTPVRVLAASSITGDNVENKRGESLGEIKDLMVNLQTGCIDYAVLKFGDLLGIGGKLFAIPFKALRLDADRKIFILDREKEYFKDAPGLDKDHWPETNSRHFEDVNTYWNAYMNSMSTIPIGK